MEDRVVEGNSHTTRNVGNLSASNLVPWKWPRTKSYSCRDRGRSHRSPSRCTELVAFVGTEEEPRNAVDQLFRPHSSWIANHRFLADTIYFSTPVLGKSIFAFSSVGRRLASCSCRSSYCCLFNLAAAQVTFTTRAVVIVICAWPGRWTTLRSSLRVPHARFVSVRSGAHPSRREEWVDQHVCAL